MMLTKAEEIDAHIKVGNRIRIGYTETVVTHTANGGAFKTENAFRSGSDLEDNVRYFFPNIDFPKCKLELLD